MQSSDGGWGAFDADNTRALVRELPFCDFGEVIDEPSADVTAHTVEMLGALGLGEHAARAARGALAARPPGAGRLVVRALGRQPRLRHRRCGAGADRRRRRARRDAVHPARGRWLERHQNEDGGWGEDPRSYDDPSWIGRGPSTASQTAWALLALHAAGERSPAARARASRGWRPTQRADGGWDEPQYTGTGLPVGLLHQLPPLPADVPDHGARPLPGLGRRGEDARPAWRSSDAG